MLVSLKEKISGPDEYSPDPDPLVPPNQSNSGPDAKSNPGILWGLIRATSGLNRARYACFTSNSGDHPSGRTDGTITCNPVGVPRSVRDAKNAVSKLTIPYSRDVFSMTPVIIF